MIYAPLKPRSTPPRLPLYRFRLDWYALKSRDNWLDFIASPVGNVIGALLMLIFTMVLTVLLLRCAADSEILRSGERLGLPAEPSPVMTADTTGAVPLLCVDTEADSLAA